MLFLAERASPETLIAPFIAQTHLTYTSSGMHLQAAEYKHEEVVQPPPLSTPPAGLPGDDLDVAGLAAARRAARMAKKVNSGLHMEDTGQPAPADIMLNAYRSATAAMENLQESPTAQPRSKVPGVATGRGSGVPQTPSPVQQGALPIELDPVAEPDNLIADAAELASVANQRLPRLETQEAAVAEQGATSSTVAAKPMLSVASTASPFDSPFAQSSPADDTSDEVQSLSDMNLPAAIQQPKGITARPDLNSRLAALKVKSESMQSQADSVSVNAAFTSLLQSNKPSVDTSAMPSIPEADSSPSLGQAPWNGTPEGESTAAVAIQETAQKAAEGSGMDAEGGVTGVVLDKNMSSSAVPTLAPGDGIQLGGDAEIRVDKQTETPAAASSSSAAVDQSLESAPLEPYSLFQSVRRAATPAFVQRSWERMRRPEQPEAGGAVLQSRESIAATQRWTARVNDVSIGLPSSDTLLPAPVTVAQPNTLIPASMQPIPKDLPVSQPAAIAGSSHQAASQVKGVAAPTPGLEVGRTTVDIGDFHLERRPAHSVMIKSAGPLVKSSGASPSWHTSQGSEMSMESDIVGRSSKFSSRCLSTYKPVSPFLQSKTLVSSLWTSQ